MRRFALFATAAWLSCLLVTSLRADEIYEIGGPLSGLKLPPSGREPRKEVELYPGSVERWRDHYMRYMPVRSRFDRQSMLRNWIVPQIPGAEGRNVEQYRAPIYKLYRDGTGAATGEFQPPAGVIRAAVQNPVFRLDLGDLSPGLYVVRLIAAVETARLRTFRLPLYVTLTVNDALDGRENTYRIRCGYTDDFFSIAEIYFHAPEQRRYSAELFVDEGSQVDVLVHNITLDDVLAGSIQRPIKTRQTLLSEAERARLRTTSLDRGARQVLAKAKARSRAERLARDEAIWNWMPRVNAQGSWILSENRTLLPGGVTLGTGTLVLAEIEGKYGKWEEPVTLDPASVPIDDNARLGVLLENKKLGLTYTSADLAAGRPLPDPYPIKDCGAGLFFPDPADPAKGRAFTPIADAVRSRIRTAHQCDMGTTLYARTGNAEIGRDAAIALIRFAYEHPTMDSASWLAYSVIQPTAGARGLDNRCWQRTTQQLWSRHFGLWAKPAESYDTLFPCIAGNEDLAQSVSRFIPWVKSSKDLIQLLDVYVVQQSAKRLMRYQDPEPASPITIATVLGDRSVTDPWMEWYFHRTWIYPMRPGGVQDLMIVSNDANGTQYFGSTMYSQTGAGGIARGLERYLAAGGNPKYDLSDATRYPKPLAQSYWQLNTVIGGQDFARIGDASGVDKTPGYTLGTMFEITCRSGWRWSADPRFAWPLAHVFGRTTETDQQWAAIGAAAAKLRRAPWLDLPSRSVSNWFGVLEAGLEHDDYRLRRAVCLRTGIGFGHSHYDPLDLQLVAYGLPMALDDGQRGAGYTRPGSRLARIHNLVEIDGGAHSNEPPGPYSWTRSLTDTAGARYLCAESMPGEKSKLYRRQVALIDVDCGPAAARLTPEQQRPGVELPKIAATADSYVLDVVRVAGGSRHTYCFHAMINDDFQWNARDVQPVPDVRPAEITPQTTPDAEYLAMFIATEGKRAGTAPATLDATWRYARQGRNNADGKPCTMGTEQEMLGKNYTAAAPRKFTALHLLGMEGARVFQAPVTSHQYGYQFTNLMVQRQGAQGLQSAFAAVIEPYAGQPLITGMRSVAVADNEADALRAVAVGIKTRNGHDDICVADGRPEKVRILPEAGLRTAGEFAYYSTDEHGLRQASLSGATVLEGPQVRLRAAQRERTARVVLADYGKRQIKLDGRWPPSTSPRVLEIGLPGHRSSCTCVSAAENGDGTSTLTLSPLDCPDLYRSRIARVSGGETPSEEAEVDELPGKKKDAADAAVAPAPESHGTRPKALDRDAVQCDLTTALPPLAGLKEDLVASDERQTRFWRATQLDGRSFKLAPGPVRRQDFGAEGMLRLWAYGPGDVIRQNTCVSLRRTGADLFEVTGDVDVEIALQGHAVELSSGSAGWEAAAVHIDGDWCAVHIDAARLSAGPVLVRLAR
jgi:hypothetical protein